MAPYIMTLDSDSDTEQATRKRKREDVALRFSFDGASSWTSASPFPVPHDALPVKHSAVPRVDINDIIARKLAGRDKIALPSRDKIALPPADSPDAHSHSDLSDDGESDGDMQLDSQPDSQPDLHSDSHPDSDSDPQADSDIDHPDSDDDFAAHADAAASNYFTEAPAIASTLPPFSALPNAALSRPILLALSAMGLSTPTKVQAGAIPAALAGKDIVASSETGSGKTVAFWVGIIERLTYRDKRTPATRVLVLCPTRELAVQVYNVGKSIARYTDITFALIVGGLSLKSQEASLAKLPDVLVSTPGRLIDHIRNTPSFTLSTLEILIIDEADRILEEGFRAELEEIISSTPTNRQTMLFSATQTESIKELERLSLRKPVRVTATQVGKTASSLTQSFIKLRVNKIEQATKTREASLLHLLETKQLSKTIIFFRSKAQAHRTKILLALSGYKAQELHGDLTQEQRLAALDEFKDGRVQALLATDLASRGLDIKGVETVINFEMPASYEIYMHRVGRTARAGKSGLSITLTLESDRKIVKKAIKHADAGKASSETYGAEIYASHLQNIEALQKDIDEVLIDERTEKELRRTAMELNKGENILKHHDEIMSRPKRTWFSSEKDKKAEKQKGKDVHNAAMGGDTSTKPVRKPSKPTHKQLRRLEAIRDMKNTPDDVKRAQNASIRKAKKAAKPLKVGALQPKKEGKSKKKKKKSAFGGK